MADHFVQHILRSGDYVRTTFECRAAEDAPCRTLCHTCIVEESREQCQCEHQEPEREPNLTTGNPCNIVVWLSEGAPEEVFDGADQPVRGPDWQPITPSWEGDYYVWDYEKVETKTWQCVCAGQGGEVYSAECPVHDLTVNTADSRWRKRYDDHLEAQSSIRKRYEESTCG